MDKLSREIKKEFAGKGIIKTEDLLADMILEVMDFAYEEDLIEKPHYLKEDEKKEIINLILNEMKNNNYKLFYNSIKRAEDTFNDFDNKE